MRQSGIGFLLCQAGRGGIVPAAFLHEGIPDLDLLVIGATSVREAPIENFLITTALQGASAQSLEVHAEKSADAVIEGLFPGDDADVVSSRQEALGIETDFIENATEDNNPADGGGSGADGKGHAPC